jgi:hypothetical protein
MVILMMGRGRGLLSFECCGLEMHHGGKHYHRTTLQISTEYSVFAARLDSFCTKDPVKRMSKS